MVFKRCKYCEKEQRRAEGFESDLKIMTQELKKMTENYKEACADLRRIQLGWEPNRDYKYYLDDD